MKIIPHKWGYNVQMSKTDDVYGWLLRKNAATIYEITEHLTGETSKTQTKYVYDKVIKPLIAQSKARRIK